MTQTQADAFALGRSLALSAGVRRARYLVRWTNRVRAARALEDADSEGYALGVLWTYVFELYEDGADAAEVKALLTEAFRDAQERG